VILFPPQAQVRLADFYAAADVVLMPSRSESFGLVALEAGAVGTPVVAAAVGGLRTVVQDGRTGFLVEGHDPGDHAERALAILRDEPLRAALGERAAHQALRFTWDVTTDAMADVYRELV
jgi:D-inositol-3-phosphate glycosyltransferase